jgi:hypothetical protein
MRSSGRRVAQEQHRAGLAGGQAGHRQGQGHAADRLVVADVRCHRFAFDRVPIGELVEHLRRRWAGHHHQWAIAARRGNRRAGRSLAVAPRTPPAELGERPRAPFDGICTTLEHYRAGSLCPFAARRKLAACRSRRQLGDLAVFLGGCGDHARSVAAGDELGGVQPGALGAGTSVGTRQHGAAKAQVDRGV